MEKRRTDGQGQVTNLRLDYGIHIYLALSTPIPMTCPKCGGKSALYKEQIVSGNDVPSPCGCEGVWLLKWYDSADAGEEE